MKLTTLTTEDLLELAAIAEEKGDHTTASVIRVLVAERDKSRHDLQKLRARVSMVIGGGPVPPESSAIWRDRALAAEEALTATKADLAEMQAIIGEAKKFEHNRAYGYYTKPGTLGFILEGARLAGRGDA